MRTALTMTSALCSLLALGAQAVTLPFERYGDPFYSRKMKVVWAATNDLPETASVFDVVAAPFSEAALAYIAAVGGTANPDQGSMTLYRRVDADPIPTHVPTRERAYELATNILTRLEIPTAELARGEERLRAQFSLETTSRYDKARRERISAPAAIEIAFSRAVDGLRCLGQEVRLRFEGEETLTLLRVNWHGLTVRQACAVARPADMIGWIRDGRARAMAVETTGSRWIKVADIRKLTVQEVEIWYDATPDWEDHTRMAETLYPFAALMAEAWFGESDYETIRLFCPVVEEGLSKPIRKTGEFNIYPSRLYEVPPSILN